jgi:hypothetical protein
MAAALVALNSERLHSRAHTASKTADPAPAGNSTRSAFFLAIAAGLTMLGMLAYGLAGVFAFLTW